MVESCKIFTYSPNNKYANMYYNACNNFDNIRNRVIDYERTHDDRESYKYQQMISEFKYWDVQVPLTSNLAGREEERLQAESKHENKQLDYYA